MTIYWINHNGQNEGGVFVYSTRDTSLSSPLISISITRQQAAKIIRNARRTHGYSIVKD